MCRFLTYSGPLTLMRPLIFSTENSLVEQSKYSKKRVRPVNGDGFGVGWYPDFDDPEPGTFLSIEPAWSNLNLAHISSKIRTQNFFAHVRDASVGMPVSEANCHPFQYGCFLWMHNGRLDQFTRFKRLLINQLSDKAYAMINGTTDSEHAFALFLDEISFDDTADAVEMERAMIATIQRLDVSPQSLWSNHQFLHQFCGDQRSDNSRYTLRHTAWSTACFAVLHQGIAGG